MATTFESQRLISVSLGKIAQSRGQRGGINLHKNLLVATVLHKARTAYMMESYNYQQNLQRQQQQQRQQAEMQQNVPVYQCQQQCQQVQQQKQCLERSETVTVATPEPMCVDQNQSTTVSSHNVISSSQESAPHISQPESNESRNSDLGQADATRTDREECRTPEASGAPVASDCPQQTPEHDSCRLNVPSSSIVATDSKWNNECTDKENSPPSVTEPIDSSSSSIAAPPIDHLAAATQLAQDSAPSNINKTSLTSGSPTCNILKRRRDNQSTMVSQPLTLDIEPDHPATKKARLVPGSLDDATKTSQTTELSCSTSDATLGSCPSSNLESDQELVYSNQSEPSSVDSPQISNLVNIFNSGFSGLCASDSDSSSDYLKANQSRPSLSRQDSFSCSSQLGRMDSVPSAIILSA